jgi:ATP-dependent DNA ligase
VVDRNPKPRPRFIEPTQCTRAKKLPENEDWLYEIKRDGYRAVGIVDGNSTVL